ncbi:MAG: NAD(P)/FAD-dependent oxidoreductase [Planctomycetota bacterium]
MDQPTPRRRALIGGGMLGMTLALRLAQAGERVTLFEAADELGGLASSWSLGDVVWDRHYHVTLRSDTHLRSLLKELDLEAEIRWAKTRTGFYVDAQLHSLSNMLEFLRFPVLSFPEKLRLAATIFHASHIRDWRPLERIPVVEWLGRWSGERVTEKIWVPLLRSKLGENYSRASAAFLWAIIARLHKARRQGLGEEMFGYVPGGYATVLSRFAARLTAIGVEIRTGHPVVSIERVANGVAVASGGNCSSFDEVVVTLPAPLCATVCRGLSATERAQLQAIRYQGIACASLMLTEPLAGYYVTNITDEWVPFTAVIEMSALVDRSYFNGNSLIYLPKYVSSEDPLLLQPDESFRAPFLEALGRMYPRFRPEHVRYFRVSRVRYVLPITTLDYSKHLPPMTTSVTGLHIVNSAHIVNGTLNVNETVALADRAARQLLADAAR